MELITIKTFDSAIDAHILKSKLESEGIGCIILNENSATLHSLYNIAYGGIKLQVRKEDAESAFAIMAEIDNRPLTNEKNEVIYCPECGSDELYPGFKSVNSVQGILATITSFLLFLMPFYYKTVYKCKKCGAEFKAK